MRRTLNIALALSLLIHCSPAFAADSEDLLPEDSGTKPAASKPMFVAPPELSGPGSLVPPAEMSTAASASRIPSDLKVDEIKVEGNRMIPTEEILKVVKTKRGDKFDRDQVVQDLKAINGLGYFDDQKMQGTPELTGSGVLLKIRVQENAPVTSFSFEGNQALSSEEISKVFSDQLGKPQNLTQLSSAIDKVEQAYRDKGFILARVADVKDDPDGSIGLSINEGVIDGIQIAGNHKTLDKIIKRDIHIQPGQVYNERKMIADLRKLYANGYYSDIRRSLSPSPNDPDKYVLKVEVDEKRSGSVGLGGGIDTIAGPFGTLSFSDNNFRGRGQVLSFNSQVGSGMFGQLSNTINNAGTQFLSNQRTYQVEASFIEPNLKGSDVSMAVTGFGRNFNSMLIDQSQQRNIGATVNFTKPLGNHITASLGVTGENVALTDLSSFYTGSTLMSGMVNRALETGAATTVAGATQLAGAVRSQSLKGGNYLSINPSIGRDTRDAKIDTLNGSLMKISASPSLGLNGATFLKAGATASKFVTVKDTTFALNAQAGEGFGAVPGFAQYRLGGFNGMRGYRQFSDLGTGSSMLMMTAEARHKIPGLAKMDNSVAQMIDKHVKLDAFFDAGQIGGNNLSNSLLARGNVGASVGIGIRVKLPMVGLIRLDYGMPLVSTLLGGNTPRISVGFGEKF
jgi:outer membrane protein insertion porin family